MTAGLSTHFQNLLSECIDSYYIKLGYIEEQWTTGGLTGGSCWGDEANRPVSSEPEPELNALDRILEKICPNITLIQYKKLVHSVVSYRSGTNHEYYGNYYEYSSKRVYLENLERYVIQEGLWTPPEE